MPLPDIPKSLYPDVPDLPGVPPLLRNPLAGAATLAVIKAPFARLPGALQGALGYAEGLLWGGITAGPLWGVFDQSNKPIAVADSVLDFGYRNNSKISNFPLQKGSFANYNKVNNPYECTIQLTKGGTVAERQAFLQAIDTVANSLDLYHIVTPEKTYLNCNMEGQSIRRSAEDGANLLVVELRFIEIREVTGQYSTTVVAKQASAASPVDAGKVAPVAVPQSALSKILNAAKGALQ